MKNDIFKLHLAKLKNKNAFFFFRNYEKHGYNDETVVKSALQ